MTDKRKVYCITIDGDIGELWLDDKLNLIGFIHANDGHTSSYHKGILWELGFDLMICVLTASPREWAKIEYEDDPDVYLEVLKPSIEDVVRRL